MVDLLASLENKKIMWLNRFSKHKTRFPHLLYPALLLSLSGCTTLTTMDFLFSQPATPEKYPIVPQNADCIAKVSFLDLASRSSPEIAVDKTFISYSSWKEGDTEQAKYQMNLQSEWQNPAIPMREYIRLSLPSFDKGVYTQTKNYNQDNARFSYVNVQDTANRVYPQFNSAQNDETQIEVVGSLANHLWGHIHAVIGSDSNPQRYLVTGLFTCNTKHVFAKETKK